MDSRLQERLNLFDSYGYAPPQAVSLEKAVLGALMLDRSAYDIVAEILPQEAFYVEVHQVIFQAIQKLASKAMPVDILTVTEEVKAAGKLEEIGGPYTIMSLTNEVVSGANVEAHARIVLQQFMRREMIVKCAQIMRDSYDDSVDVFDLIDNAESEIFSISQQHMQSNFYTMSDTMVAVAKQVEMRRSMDSDVTGVESGFEPIDKITHGWQDTDLIIMAARPSVGKTAFALNLARNAAKSGTPVGLFELEMSKEQCGMRWAAAESSIPLDSISTGKMDDSQWKHFMKTGIYELGQEKIYIDDRAGITMLSIRSKARKMVNKHDVGLIIIDYLQLIEGVGKSANREQEISKISRDLKKLAKDLHVPVIALSQLSREVEKRADKTPMLADLRESGAIEQDADVVMFLWGPTKEEIGQDASLANIRYWKCAKHRNGSLDEGALPFYPQFQRFENPGPVMGTPTSYASTQFPSAGIRRYPQVEAEEELPPF